MRNLKLFILSMLIMAVFINPVQSQQYPLRTIEEIQFVLHPGVNDQSFFVGDTMQVRGLVMNNVRDLALDSSWACFIVNPDLPADPWQGLLIVQIDTLVPATLFSTVQPGMMCRFTGVVRETETFTQIEILTDPLMPVVIESAGSFLPQPILLGTDDLNNRENGEQWEGQLVRITDALVTDNAYSSNRAIIEDNSGMPAYMDDFFSFYNNMFINGTFNWPPFGSIVDVTGFVRGLNDGLSINPRNFADLSYQSSGPEISQVLRDPVVPGSTDTVRISATIIDNNSVTSASLYYSVDSGPWSAVGMSAVGDQWSAGFPPQSDGSFIRYYISATDNEGFESMLPADTSHTTGNIFRYVVRNNGLSIADVQNTYGYGVDESGYLGFNVSLQGVVMSGPTHFPGYYIQDAAAAWSGIFVRGNLDLYEIGDWISVTGRIEEDFGLTKLQSTSSSLLIENFGAFDPVPNQTGDLATGGALAEAYESVFVSFANITVTDAFPDLPNNFGEFIIDDGSGGMRVDDESEMYEGNLGSAIETGAFGTIQGIHFYSFGDFKLAPRDSSDVDFVLGINEDARIPGEFVLKQNYPNPFNPSTNIQFRIPKATNITLNIYNTKGQLIRNLVTERMAAGKYSILWDGANDTGAQVSSGMYFYRFTAGKSVQIRKMILMK